MAENQTPNQTPMTYAGTGVDYSAMDPFKVEAQKIAGSTNHFVERFGFKVVDWSRGESAFLIEMPTGYLAFLVEGLGSKSRGADEYVQLLKEMHIPDDRTFFVSLAQCNVAMQVNDIITLGTLPISIAQYLAVGDSDWFKDQRRCADLVEGTRKAAELARCSWGPGETPTLLGIIEPGTCDLAGAAVGWLADKTKVFNPSKIRHHDSIVMIESSGIHANGITLARKIGKRLPQGFLTKLSDGQTFGEALLTPTHIYVGLIDDCLKEGIDIHYAVNITGHGWRKLMRAPQPWAYVINRLPREKAIFDCIQEHGPVTVEEMYGNFNMGAGFALYMPSEQARGVCDIARELGFRAFIAGYVAESDEKTVVIEPKDIVFRSDSLQVR
jgi:phosphoribosylformylglycinamidine cyclo-ligase